ncbi:methylated-DNA--[protein]-cysteine S-methyltransferase [Paenibacillus dakarensis]|uniref:methylated-DNA--[protein]-cysteine S-methyltransferase n=1 Tax=Paenibacillus dakarensis TaxID=1527293 RepID=UPI0006D56A1B|nr:methylated-DNA--[protein]-cysteine S-methyltransferase [Paenibacillus dakarensis]
MHTFLNKEPSVIYWTLFKRDNWNMYIAATGQGLCYIGSNNAAIDEMKQWINRFRPGLTMIQDDEKLLPYVEELQEYLAGMRQTLSQPVDIKGTPFQQTVWQALSEIPYGTTWSYSDIAHHIQKPASVRAVGAAIGANPLLITVPCHRVIGKNGSLTGYRGGLEMKTRLLELERQNLVNLQGGMRSLNL